MIDLTPLDVRKKKGDFRKGLRGYDPEEVDVFMDLVAERLEGLVKENLALRERIEGLQSQVQSQEGREHAVKEALVTAQELRDQMREQTGREAELIRREARAEAREIVAEAEQRAEWMKRSIEELERKRLRFLKAFRGMLERELDGLDLEEERKPLDELAVDELAVDEPAVEVSLLAPDPPDGADDEERVEQAFERMVEADQAGAARDELVLSLEQERMEEPGRKEGA